jgi:dihydrofolate reductase
MRIALVAAVAQNGVIGARGKLPWRISDDLKWFKRVTLGKPIVMGRKTFDSIGKALPGRDNIVITRRPETLPHNVVGADSLARALNIAKEHAEARSADEVCVIGGAEVFREALPLASRIYLTQVLREVPGDVFFPDWNPAEWRATPAGSCEAGPTNDYPCEFLILDRPAAEAKSGQ